MPNEPLAGAWTYRSFLNVPDPVDDFNKLRFGEGELIFETAAEPGTMTGQLAFRSSPPDPRDPRLRLGGAVGEGTPLSVRFQGVGVEKTAAEGWVYDYIGYLVPHWPDGKGQREAWVGSVIRTVPHAGSGGRTSPAGIVGSFIAVRRDFPEPRQVIPLPVPVREMLASRGHRLHHMVWHSVRDAWLDPNTTDEQRKQIHDLGWEPPRPALTGTGAPIIRNGSGEDFLFMHRQMIGMVNEGMAAAGAPSIAGWKTIPAPGPLVQEPDYQQPPVTLQPPGNPTGFTVPPGWIDPNDPMTNRRIASLKTDDYYWSKMRWWDRKFKNSQYLSTLTLGELGSLIEFSVHNDMHMRWSSVPRDPATGESVPSGRRDPDIRKQWDDPAYDFLGEFYSSHVNPVFWRLHGWVDDRIEDWFAAHEAVHAGEVRRREVDGMSWFEAGHWVQVADPWPAPKEQGHAGHEGHGDMYPDIGKMEQVVTILFGPPPEAEKGIGTALLLDTARDMSPESSLRQRKRTWF